MLWGGNWNRIKPRGNNTSINKKKIYIVYYPSNENRIYKKNIKKPTIKQNEEMFSEIKIEYNVNEVIKEIERL